MKLKDLLNMKAPEGYKYMVIVPNYWGKGDTIGEACSNVRKAGGDTDGSFSLALVDPSAKIDGLGGVARNSNGKVSVQIGIFKAPKR